MDANLLLYSYVVGPKRHDVARKWLEPVFSGDTPVLIPWHSIAAFIRIGTNPRLSGRPVPLATDAELAAFPIGVGGVLHSTDRDFARFSGKRWKNPLV